jgi:hypothetical protein
MTPERAMEIVTAINDRAMWTMGFEDRKPGSLAGVSLAEMIEAVAIIEAENRHAELVARTYGGGHSIKMTPDDRLIAAAYCMEHYPCSRDAILAAPATRSERFEFELPRKALAIVPIPAPAQSEEKEDAREALAG